MRSVAAAVCVLVGRARLGVLVLPVGICMLFGLPASGAWGSKGVVSVFGSAGSGDGQFANAAATAVNLGSGDVYVVDQLDHRVEHFDSSGGFLGAFGWGVADGNSAAETCSSGCQAGISGSGDGQFDTPQGVAVDQSDGSVYVVDGNNNRVEKFDASGTYLSQFGSAGSAEGQFSGPQGAAVDPTDGSVYVADAGNNRVQKFDNSGAFVSMFGFGVADGNSVFETCSSSCQAGIATGDDGALNFPTRLAVDSTGRVYVLDLFNGRIERYTAGGAFDEVFDPTDVNPNTFAAEIAIGPGNDRLYVAQAAPDYSEQRVFEIDDTGTLIDTHAVGAQVFNASGLALNAGSQNIYLADGFAARALILGDITPPDLTIDPASNVTATSASLSGSVTPNGDPPVGWHFEISTDDASWTPTGADQDAGNGATPVPVNQNITGLVPNTNYFARLAATRSYNATTPSSEIQFSTPAIAPTVTTQQAQDIAPTHAALPGLINPNHSPTTYYFEYGPTTAYGTSIPATRDGDAGAANGIGAVVRRIDGLHPGSTYHFRLVASNDAGVTAGQDQAFTTSLEPPASSRREGIPGSGFLPDQRGWEKVTPNDKNGGDVMADSQRTRAASDGDAVQFASLAAFGDAVGTSIATDYMSTRSTDGWTTHAITPSQAPLTITPTLSGLQSLYDGPFSSDLSSGVFLGWSPVTVNPSVASVPNIYLRKDLISSGLGSYQLLSACPACEEANTPLPAPLPRVPREGRPSVAGASADFGHVIFESQQPLTSDTPAGCDNNLADPDQCPPHLYEWDHGTVRLAGVLPDGECSGVPPCAAFSSEAGQGASLQMHTPHTISADGSRIFFTVPESAGSSSGGLYVRLNHVTTAKLNASERTDCADHDPCSGTPEPDPGGVRSATYWDASTDGSRVFFTTPEALTNDAPVNGDSKLYMYDTTISAATAHNLTLVSRDNEPADGADVQTVLGASSDGHYVYFLAAGQLVSGELISGFNGPSFDRGIYVWHDGTVRFIAPGSASDAAVDTTTTDWVFRVATSRVTPDGLHLLFGSSIGATGYDQTCANGGTCRELYLYSYDSGRLACASCNPTGAHPIGDPFVGERTNNGVALGSSTKNSPLSEDGKHVYFNTPDALVPQDVNARVDVYEYDVASGTVHMLTTGQDLSDSYFLGASAPGGDVFFITRAQLTRVDADNSYDLYDARAGGGFIEPQPASPPCAGEACRGSQSGAPSEATPGTSLVTGNGNLPTKRIAKPKPRRCRRGYVRKKVRGRLKCVKVKKTRHKTAKTTKRTRLNAVHRRPR